MAHGAGSRRGAERPAADEGRHEAVRPPEARQPPADAAQAASCRPTVGRPARDAERAPAALRGTAPDAGTAAPGGEPVAARPVSPCAQLARDAAGLRAAAGGPRRAGAGRQAVVPHVPQAGSLVRHRAASPDRAPAARDALAARPVARRPDAHAPPDAPRRPAAPARREYVPEAGRPTVAAGQPPATGSGRRP